MMFEKLMKKFGYVKESKVYANYQLQSKSRLHIADVNALKAMNYINEARSKGFITLKEIAHYLNEQTDSRSPRGSLWSYETVRRAIARVEKIDPEMAKIPQPTLLS